MCPTVLSLYSQEFWPGEVKGLAQVRQVGSHRAEAKAHPPGGRRPCRGVPFPPVGLSFHLFREGVELGRTTGS